MPKMDTGYTPNRSQSNPTDKTTVPLKSPGMTKQGMPTPIKTPNMTANMAKPVSVKASSPASSYKSYSSKPIM